MDANIQIDQAPIPLGQRFALRLEELAEAFGVSRRTIQRERAAGRFPKPDLIMGKMPLWKPETIRQWVDGGNTR
jgi:predicted DNA-binding transcriptional regulator AlpA